MKRIRIIIVFTILLGFGSCESYLDIVPDEIATIDHAFALRSEAEKYFFTCYSYLPMHASVSGNPAWVGGDELYITTSYRQRVGATPWYIAHGMQNKNTPYCDYWGGMRGGVHLFRGISDCNIFLENIKSVPDMSDDERNRWAAEVKVLKAYYHFWLVRMYGPIPIKDVNVPIYADEEETKPYRNTLDECFEYIVNLLYEVIQSGHLPDEIENRADELGRITQGIAMTIKAEVLLTAASPLFCGNTDYQGFVDVRGVEIFSPNKTEDEKKQRWADAAVACKEAIDFLTGGGLYELYDANKAPLLSMYSSETRAKLSIRNAVTERWNKEIIWANTNSIAGELQTQSLPRVLNNESNSTNRSNLAVPLKIAEQFYSKNGVPLKEDKFWAGGDYDARFDIRRAVDEEKYFMSPGYMSAQFNFDREIRYYAGLGFDGGVWFGQGVTDETAPIVILAKAGQRAAPAVPHSWNETGIWPKKLVHYKTVLGASSGITQTYYPFPIYRLSNLYLMYAEALHEKGGEDLNNILYWVDLVRSRAGLSGVKNSWDNFTHSAYSTKYTTYKGLQEIIRQERLIELAFEGQRFWDLRRWRVAHEVLNAPVTGWSIRGETESEYYIERFIYKQSFTLRDYFWPIYEEEILCNQKNVQNPGW